MRRRNAGRRKVCAFAMDRMVKMLGEGIIDDADEGFELVGEG